MEETVESPATQLCKACGLCCNGQLFIWVKLRPAELDPAEALGMPVLRTDPNQRGFNQPCPLWQGVCTIYTSRHYPHACRAYKCALLKEVISEKTSLPAGLESVRQTKALIVEVESLLPAAETPNFRERMVAQIEARSTPGPNSPEEQAFQAKAQTLLGLYANVFGVRDVLENQAD